MQLVIDIPEDTYKDVLKNGFIYDEDNEVVTHAIKNGTPHETVTEFADRCRECGRERVLDKIRAEIDEQYDRVHPYNISCAEGLEMALGIIDRYRAERGDKE